MAKSRKKRLQGENRDAYMSILADPDTPPEVQVSILRKMFSETEADTFFATMFRELSSFGECPECGHENHWAVPENDLNQMGYVSAARDPRVKRAPTDRDCPEFGQACPKKKIIF